ncbi:MAG: serine protease [Rhodococcus sp. (in: high G+C Gram-positive bacteria)]|uniref:serine protease n=1 Tax=Rhodococcus sp. TaxID=1831 RepID=UPI003BB0CEA5
MKRFHLLLAGLLGLSLGAVPAAAAAPGAAVSVVAVPSVSVGPGTAYTTDPGMEGYCTIAVVGHDNEGRLVALTVGHCHQRAGQAVYKVGEAEAGPIGHETDVFSGSRDGTFGVLDYAVIELDPSVVVPSNSGPDVDAVVNNVGDAALWNIACKFGPSTGKTCGVITKLDHLHLQNWAAIGPGDSGAPLIIGDTLVGISMGVDFATGSPFYYGRITPILEDIDSRGSYGAGFTPVSAD